MSKKKAWTRRDFIKGAVGTAAAVSVLGKVDRIFAQAGSITVGVFGDVTTATGKDLKAAADFAAASFNVNLVPVSSAADAKNTVGILSLLPDDAAVATLASQVTDVAIIDAVNTAPYLTRLAKSAPTLFRLPAHELMALQNFFKAASDFKVKQRSFLYVSKDRPGLTTDFTLLPQVISHNEIQFTVTNLAIPKDTTAAKMPDQAAIILGKKPDAVILSLDPELAAVVVKAVAAIPNVDNRPAVIVHEPYGLNIQYFLTNLTQQERTSQKWVFYNLQYIAPAADKQPATFKAVNDAFNKKVGHDIDALNFMAYTGVQAFANAKQKTANGVIDALNSGNALVTSGQNMLIDLWGDVTFGEFDFQDVRQNQGATPMTARINDKGQFELSPVGVSPLGRNVFIQIGNFICNNLICGSF